MTHLKLHGALFILMLVYFVLFFQLYEIWHFGPTSVHQWRQADSASQALCYYENGMHFFQTKVHNMLSGHNAATGEFPILYYITALIYHLTGPEELVLRMINFLILMSGIYGLSRVILDLTQNPVFSVLLAGSLFCSPVLVFYGFNFIPNAPAVGLSLLAFWFYWIYLKNRELKWFFRSAAAICFAGLIKPTLLVVGIAWLAVWLISFIFYEKEGETIRGFFPAWKITLVTFALVLAANIAWILWARHYNEINMSGVFLTKANPFWDVPLDSRKWIWNNLWVSLMPRFSLREMFWLFLGTVGISLIFFRRFSIAFRWFWVFLLIGTTAVFFLFFKQLEAHDYYLIDLMPFYFLSFGAVVFIFNRAFKHKWLGWALAPVLVVFLNWNAVAVRKHMLKYYEIEQKFDFFRIPGNFQDAKGLRAYLSKLGIRYSEHQAITYPDASPNVTLYLVNLRGWSMEPGRFTQGYLNFLKSCGADYLFVFGKENLQNEVLIPFMKNQIGAFKEQVFIFKIGD